MSEDIGALFDELDFICHEMDMYKKSLEDDEEFWSKNVLHDPNQKIACVRRKDDD